MDIGQCRHVFTVYCNNTLLKISSQCHFKKKDGCLESNPVPFSVKQPNQELRKFAFIFGVSVQNSSFPFKISNNFFLALQKVYLCGASFRSIEMFVPRKLLQTNLANLPPPPSSSSPPTPATYFCCIYLFRHIFQAKTE